MPQYRCSAPECANRPPYKSSKHIQRCLYCGANNPTLVRRPARVFMMSALFLMLIAGLVWSFLYYFNLEGPEENSQLILSPPIPCELTGVVNNSTDGCVVIPEPIMTGECLDSLVEFRHGTSESTSSSWERFVRGRTILDLRGKTSVYFAFRVNGITKDTTITVTSCGELDQALLEERKNTIIQAIKDFLKNPTGPAKYDAHRFTHMVPNGDIHLPDRTTTSGLSWQTDIFILWPGVVLDVEVELDEYGSINDIRFKLP